MSKLRNVRLSGECVEEEYDVVVLAVGQRPAAKVPELARLFDLELNHWGFCETSPFSLTTTSTAGITLGGSFSGLKDINESVTQASAASVCASRVIHSAGGGLAPQETESQTEYRDVSRELPKIHILACTCEKNLSPYFERADDFKALESDPAVAGITFIDRVCTNKGWESLTETVKKSGANRVLIGACLPYVYGRKLKELGKDLLLKPHLMDVVDIRTAAFSAEASKEDSDVSGSASMMKSELKMGISRLKRIEPEDRSTVAVKQQALVAGGGIAGMTAALAIADHGFPVDLVEKNETLGGNLSWLKRTLEGDDPGALLEETIQKVEKHPKIEVYTKSRLMGTYGEAGLFLSTIENENGEIINREHGSIIIATGGTEAKTDSYGYGKSERIVTQKEFEEKTDGGQIDWNKLETVVMIQCVDSREEPRNYCSRVCCKTALKNALHLKEKNPECAIYVLYRDMMSYGFSETFFTEARKKDIVFIPYDIDKKPRVDTENGNGEKVTVKTFEPIIGQDVEIDADLLILATGVNPNLPSELVEALGVDIDEDGFFAEADFKWRPVDSMKEGVFACGLALSPRSISETIATAEAAAQRTLRILSRKYLPTSKIVAAVHHSM